VSLSISHAGKRLFESRPTTGGRWLRRDLTVPWQQGGLTTNLQVQLGVNVAQEARLLERLAWTLLGAVVLGTALVSLTGMWLVRRGLRPLKALADRTAAMAPDKANQPIDALAFAEELRPWITQFNALLLRVQRAYVQLESFNADVAHELRTPLANLIGSTELALTRQRSNEELQGVLTSNLEEIGRLSGIVTDMLFLSKADRGTSTRSRAVVSLAAQARDVIDFYDAMLDEAGLEGRSHRGCDGRRGRLARSPRALQPAGQCDPLRRACFGHRHRTEGGPRRVHPLGREPRGADRPGRAPRLFERFYRAAQARDGSTRHHGLGLPSSRPSRACTAGACSRRAKVGKRASASRCAATAEGASLRAWRAPRLRRGQSRRQQAWSCGRGTASSAARSSRWWRAPSPAAS
jgi:two-component system heavy metal sensor histidine kinase CusS